MSETVQETKEKKPKSLFAKIGNIFFYTLICIVIVVALLYTVVTVTSDRGVSTLFGHTVQTVQSGSMSGTIEVGDMIISEVIEGEEAQVGDVVSFFYKDPDIEQIIVVTHRIIEIREDGKIITQGDVANRAGSVDQVEYIARGDIISRYNGFRIPFVGKAVDFLNTSLGFFICILIPVFLFLFWEIYMFIVTVSDARKIDREKKINDQARALAEQMLADRQAQEQQSDDTQE